MIGEKEITLTLRKGQTKNGDWIYRREGVKASVTCNQRLFKRGVDKNPPKTLTLTSSEDEVFRLRNNLDPEEATRRIELLQQRIQRKQELGSKALTKAEALQEKVSKLTAALDEFEG